MKEHPPIIYLEPECGADPSTGSLWCEDDVFSGECRCDECHSKDPEDRAKPTKYVRVDIIEDWLNRYKREVC